MDKNTLSTTELLSAGRERTAVEEFLHSAAYAGLQAPIQGVTQIAEQVTGKSLVPSVTFMDAPEHAQFGTSRWHAQSLGSMVGMAAPFLLAHKGVGKLGNAMLGKVESTAANQALLAQRVIGETAVTGAMYEGLLRPTTAQEGDFLTARTRNALVGGATFATLATASVGIRSLARAENSMLGSIARNEVAATALAGVPAGLVNAELTSLASGKGLANRQQLTESVYTFSVLGGSMAAGKLALGRTHSEQGLNRELRADSEQARANGEPTLAERAKTTLNGAVDGLNTLSDRMAGPQAQLGLAGIGGPVRFTDAAPIAPTILEMRRTNQPGGRPLKGGIGNDVVEYAPPASKPTQTSLDKANQSLCEAQDAPAAKVDPSDPIRSELVAPEKPRVITDSVPPARLIEFEKESGAGKHTYWIPNRKNPRIESGLDRKVVYGEDGKVVAEVKFDRARTSAQVDAELSRMMREPKESQAAAGKPTAPEANAGDALTRTNVMVPPEQLIGFFTDRQSTPLSVLKPDSIMGILAGEPYPDLGRFAVELYREAGRNLEQRGLLRTAKTEAQLQQLFAETIRDILPEFRRNWTTPVEPSSLTTLFGAPPKEVVPPPPAQPTEAQHNSGSADHPTSPTDVVQSSVSPYTVRAVLQLAANDMSNIGGRVSPGALQFASIAQVASMSRNLHGRGGLPLNPATAQAVVNRALAEGLLTPTDTVPTLQARIDALANWESSLRFTKLRR